MNKKNTLIIKTVSAILFLSAIYSCKQDSPEPVKEYDKSEGVFICNEGNYTYGNASLSFYDPENKQILNDIFYNANDFPLGDVCMSAAIKDSIAFLIINNSGKISVINTNTFKHIATISNLTSPRYMCIISDTKAYVTDLYNTNITVINPSDFTITGSVAVGKGSEQITLYKNFAYVTGWSYNDKIYKINTDTDILTDSLTVTKQPNSICLDCNNKLWVLSDGGFDGIPGGQDTAALTKIDAETFSIEKIFKFPSLEPSPSRLTINASGDTLFFINSSWSSGEDDYKGIYKMSVNSGKLPGNSFIPADGKLFYGLGTDPANSDIYVSDAVDYIQRGNIYRYSSNGTILDTFRTGIIPSFFAFKK